MPVFDIPYDNGSRADDGTSAYLQIRVDDRVRTNSGAGTHLNTSGQSSVREHMGMVLNTAVMIDATARVETNVVADDRPGVHNDGGQHNHARSQPRMWRNDGGGVNEGCRLDSSLPDELEIPLTRRVVAESNYRGVNEFLGRYHPQLIRPAENWKAKDIRGLLRGGVIQQPGKLPIW